MGKKRLGWPLTGAVITFIVFLSVPGPGAAQKPDKANPDKQKAAFAARRAAWKPYQPATKVERTIKANVVALDQCFMVNRLGASIPQGMMFALRRDVVSTKGPKVTELKPGEVMLRADKRPRPLVLRMNVGDCLEITFTNLLANPTPIKDTRAVGIHVMGMQLIDNIGSDGSFVGRNDSGLVKPGEPPRVYKLFAAAEGSYLLYSTGADFQLPQTGTDQLSAGLFGSVIVEPPQAEWYRSQVTREDLKRVQKKETVNGKEVVTYNYAAKYEDGTPVLAMLNDDMPKREIIHSDLAAVITGPKARAFPDDLFSPVRVLPDRSQPFREFVLHYHDALTTTQAFRELDKTLNTKPELFNALSPGQDTFAINYGIGGIGAEILANPSRSGPCTRASSPASRSSSSAPGSLATRPWSSICPPTPPTGRRRPLSGTRRTV